ncbi:MAG: acyltransferase family protein [Marivita sp.]|uniref:acyltransferase family protein n=1 Tax=Marivita sp. TaxID=2003365 RepID=UPI003EF28D02
MVEIPGFGIGQGATVGKPVVRLSDKIGGRDNHFDQIRLSMAILVVLGHSWYLAFGPEVQVPFAWLTIHGFHQYAVYLFFFISGLLVTESARRRETDLFGFTIARLFRIFPALMVCAVLTPMLLIGLGAWTDAGLVEGMTYALRLISLVAILFEAPGAFEGLPFPHALNGSVWSLRHEVAAYALLGIFAATGMFFRSRLVFWTYAAVVLFLASVGHLLADSAQGGFAFLLAEGRYVVVAFLFGVVAHRVAHLLPISGRVACIVWLLVVTLAPRLPEPIAIYMIIAALSYSVLCLAYLGAAPKGMPHDISYGVYIYGWPIQQLVVMAMIGIVGTVPSPMEIFTVALPILAVLAYLSWRWIEKPAMRLGQRRQVNSNGTNGPVFLQAAPTRKVV